MLYVCPHFCSLALTQLRYTIRVIICLIRVNTGCWITNKCRRRIVNRSDWFEVICKVPQSSINVMFSIKFQVTPVWLYMTLFNCYSLHHSCVMYCDALNTYMYKWLTDFKLCVIGKNCKMEPIYWHPHSSHQVRVVYLVRG